MLLHFGIMFLLFGSYVTLFGLIIFLFNIFLSLITFSLLRSLNFKNENLSRILYIQYFSSNDINFDFYDLLHFLYQAYKGENDFSFDGSKKTNWLVISSCLCFCLFWSSFEIFSEDYAYSSYYKSVQNKIYALDDLLLKISGKNRPAQNFLDFFLIKNNFFWSFYNFASGWMVKAPVLKTEVKNKGQVPSCPIFVV